MLILKRVFLNFLKMKFTFSRIKQELFRPTNKHFRNLLNFIYSIKNFSFTKKGNNKTLLIWDVRSNPITFDFIFALFFTYSKLIRKQKINSFDLLIYFPKSFKLKSISFGNYDKYVNDEEINLRIQKMILPLANSFNCVDKIYFLNDEKNLLAKFYEYSNIYPRNYNPKYFIPIAHEYKKCYEFLYEIESFNAPFLIPEKFSFFNAQKSLLKILDINFITLTLRDYGYSPSRNTTQHDIEESIKVANNLKCKLVLVPDNVENLSNYTINSDTIICKEARNNMKSRIKLYSKSKLNIFTTSGTKFVSLFIKRTKTIILNFCPGCFDGNKRYYKNEYNINVGDQPYLYLGGYLLWHDQYPSYNSEDILYFYKKLCKNLTIK